MLARCATTAAFTAALPGGAHLDRGPDTPGGAYAIFTFERGGPPEWFSDGSYLQEWKLRMVAYTVGGLSAGYTQPATGAETAAQAAQLAMAAALNPDPTGWAALRDGRVNCCLPEGCDGKHAPQLREGRDVFAAAGQWSMLIEGNRTP